MADICSSICPGDLWFSSIRLVLPTKKHIDQKNPDPNDGIGFSGGKKRKKKLHHCRQKTLAAYTKKLYCF